MTRFRFVHAADLHLDSPFKGLRAAAPDHVADGLHHATFRAYENIIALCIDEGVDALLVAGDVYDGADRSLRAQRKFVDGLGKLAEAGIRSFVCHGNHDPLDGWEARLDYPRGCHRFGAQFEAVPVFPEEPGRAVVHGISYPRRDVTENLVQHLGPVDPETFSIGLLHTNVGNIPGHDLYAPCSLDDLRRSGIDYWALGHIHTRQVLQAQRPAVVYPGNPQGRHLNEAGARGVYLVEVDDTGAVNPQFRAADSVRWENLNVDIGAQETEQNLIDALREGTEKLLHDADGRPVVFRTTLVGRGALNRFLRRENALSELAEQINEDWTEQVPFAWCERIVDESRPLFDRRERLAGADFLAEVLRTSDRVRSQPKALGGIREGLVELYGHHRFRRFLGDTPTDDELASLIDEAEMLVVDLLAEGGE